ncbi:flavodoxin family protein [Arthrobacter koreensis]|uniref:flavodoxin family protein n=1 Tax=Arthrobacter koreensis TaxID=199136 RepID=UPI002DB9BA67|nr:flavodoxin domain-containing protein [Arthrobacter koreensis]MEB7505753.1 flavodoxin [Arthrobacter koreensis]
MKAVVLYDSAYGNTRRIAEAIDGSLEDVAAEAIQVPAFRPGELRAGDLLVVGSPINGWRPTPIISAAVEALGPDQLEGVKAAAFDTRVRLFVHGDAAGKLSEELRRRGAEIISAPQPFFVKGTEGPLVAGEVEKAAFWGRSLLHAVGL